MFQDKTDLFVLIIKYTLRWSVHLLRFTCISIRKSSYCLISEQRT